MHSDTPPPLESQEHYDAYWNSTESSYPAYPTIRHRKRFILRAIEKHCGENQCKIFDFGCGEGSLLQDIQQQFALPGDHIAGNDISEKAVIRAREKVPEGTFHHAALPEISAQYDVIICSEVIEHTTKYRDIIRWIADHLAPGGLLILSTQAGKIHASDRYTGHTQHFVKADLDALLQEEGFTIESSRLWGWPLFTLQKYLTDVSFDRVREGYLEGGLTRWKRFIFAVTYRLYFLHDAIPFGPQIYIKAAKK
ncbi:MAG: class I SAM-dependent methyltransferase [Candidatus Peregrinibacteria bacterium]|nr:class I SAM-dependent methyltransferase [Candidatus Peregrinibacteria bacterium]